VSSTIESTAPGDPRPGQLQRTICKRTGLALVKTHQQTTFRIAKSSYGAMNPILRDVKGDPRQWGRYDVAGHRTIYSANPVEAAYAESLAVYRPAKSLDALTLGELFDDETEPGLTLSQAVAEEWDHRFHTQPGYVPAAWRDERLIHKVALPMTGWVIDVEHANTLATLNAALPSQLAGLLPEHRNYLTTSDLHGEDRRLTTLIAQWLRAQVLEDGSLPHGILYRSKHGSNWRCWAIWLRIVDDGDDPTKDIGREPTTLLGLGMSIYPPERNPPLRMVADLFRLDVK
jgi:RES domain-containing protein